jgi:CheY-like chemotaxis protein
MGTGRTEGFRQGKTRLAPDTVPSRRSGVKQRLSLSPSTTNGVQARKNVMRPPYSPPPLPVENRPIPVWFLFCLETGCAGAYATGRPERRRQGREGIRTREAGTVRVIAALQRIIDEPRADRTLGGVPGGKPVTLLIVDDYEDALDLLDVTLSLAGYRTIRASNGVEAVYMARTHRPSAIVMDLFLPQLDGSAAARAVRSTPGLEAVPIIGYTARCGALEDEGAVFTRVLRKPCPPDVLLETISDVLGQHCPAARASYEATGQLTD